MKNVLITLLSTILGFIAGMFTIEVIFMLSDDGYEALSTVRKSVKQRIEEIIAKTR